MLLKDISNISSFLAGDETILKEILHPNNDAIDIQYSIAHARLEIGKKSLPHQLKSSEVYLVLQGKGEVHIDAEVSEITANQLVFIPKNAMQWIENTGDTDLVFLCIVEPFWKMEDEVVL